MIGPLDFDPVENAQHERNKVSTYYWNFLQEICGNHCPTLPTIGSMYSIKYKFTSTKYITRKALPPDSSVPPEDNVTPPQYPKIQIRNKDPLYIG